MGVARYTAIKYSLLNIFNLKGLKRLIFASVLIIFVLLSMVIIANFYLTGMHYLPNSLCSAIPNVIMSLPLKVLMGLNSFVMFFCFLLSVILYIMLLKYVNCSQESMKELKIYCSVSKLNSLRSNAIWVCLSLGVSYVPSSLMLLISLFTSKFTTYFQMTIILVLLPISSILNPLVYKSKYLRVSPLCLMNCKNR